jgi:membrane-bound metal-dependent hydrolase YbcI (DUF457 family)
LFTYLGIEHTQITPNAIHLDFLPYSHSLLTGILLAALAWTLGKTARYRTVGAAIALGVISHTVLDIVHHEPNIALLPMQWGPRFGLNLQGYPILDFLVELAFCIGCWAIFRGTRPLLIALIVFNVLNIPIMFPTASLFSPLVGHPNYLTTLVLIQIVATWVAVWWFGKETIILEDAVPIDTPPIGRTSPIPRV